MDQLISAEDAATVLNISNSTLAKMRLSGKSPRYIKLGRRVAYRPSDLEAWIEAQSFNSTAEYSEKGGAHGN
jgi:excisionase family DNA binding protein